MKLFAKALVVGLLASVNVTAANSDALVVAPVVSPVLDLKALVAGEDYEALSARWWQWTFAFPAGLRPYDDPDGRLCDLGQDGPVWFLAGTGGDGSVKRRCSVPADKVIFLPIINMFAQQQLASSADTVRAATCTELQADTAMYNDKLVSAVVVIDGQPLANVVGYRARTARCFDPYPDADSPEGSGFLAASDGYWLLLKLPPGRHTISVGANYGNRDVAYGKMVQNFEYELDIGGPTI